MEIEKESLVEEIRTRKGCKRKGLGFKYLKTEGPPSHRKTIIYIDTLTFLHIHLVPMPGLLPLRGIRYP